MHKRLSKVKAFTLVELLVVIAIIGILEALLCPQFKRLVKRHGDRNVRTTSSKSHSHFKFGRFS